MPERTVLLGGMTYIDEDGIGQFGLQGQTVAVHPDNLERFDSLNVDPGPPHNPEMQSVDMVSGGGAEKPQPRRARSRADD